MAVTPVLIPQKKGRDGSDLSNLGKLAGMAAPFAGPASPYLMAFSAGTQLKDTLETPEQAPQAAPQLQPTQELDMPDRGMAIARREAARQQDTAKLLQEGREALAGLDIDPEIKLRLSKPIDAALQMERKV